MRRPDPPVLAAGRRILFRPCAQNSRFRGPEPWLVDRIGLPEAAHQCRRKSSIETEGFAMLGWVVTFLIVALIAGILGFGGIAGASVEIAKIIFFIAVVLFLVSAVMGVARGRDRV
jgi:uncharacterized membrane protein YtjA (UPF0391 family)